MDQQRERLAALRIVAGMEKEIDWSLQFVDAMICLEAVEDELAEVKRLAARDPLDVIRETLAAEFEGSTDFDLSMTCDGRAVKLNLPGAYGLEKHRTLAEAIPAAKASIKDMAEWRARAKAEAAAASATDEAFPESVQ